MLYVHSSDMDDYDNKTSNLDI